MFFKDAAAMRSLAISCSISTCFNSVTSFGVYFLARSDFPGYTLDNQDAATKRKSFATEQQTIFVDAVSRSRTFSTLRQYQSPWSRRLPRVDPLPCLAVWPAYLRHPAGVFKARCNLSGLIF
jgi:hypothetical protein